MLAKFGDVVSAFAIEKLTMAKNQKVIVSLLSENIVITKTHFIPDVGFIHCFEGKCCEDHGLPSVRYGLHVVKYQSDGGINIVGDQLEFMLLAIGQKDYKNLLTKDQILKQQGSSLVKKDLLVTCVDEQYQNKTFDILGDARWRKILSKEEFRDKMEYFTNNAERVFGRVVDSDSYTKLIEQMGAGPVVDRQTIDQAKKALPASSSRPAPKSLSAPKKPEIEVPAEQPAEVVSADDFDDLLD